ncbi:nSTAND1 domain-containing NTPase [Streptomyces viridosporus]|uniref:Helix-turn-helix domain-containing protein n=1 Tax=Streptomyces viridosporus T7A TaxID=665577 RepID=A0ABX6A726_STRVD|nr:helix-turn-helix domain-containing protein [Streptomyces viridosporus]QEU83493.1 helix-turn-helix domain-containing protein [Streptomyces viridosporus T7A]
MAGRREVPVDPGAGPVQRFAFELRKLRAEAGGITYRVLAQRAGYSVTTLSQAAAGEQLPTLPVALAYAAACGGDPLEWQARWKQAVEEAASADSAQDGAQAAAPYKGLARFEAGDRDVFFGRERLVADLLELLRRRRFVAVFGASGSGKSSLLRAGLVPALQHTRDAGLRPAVIRILTPGERPAHTHAHVLVPGGTDAQAGVGAGGGEADTFVVVDQFEEVFTLCQDPAERARFLDLLLTACRPESRLRVVIAVRADFYGRCAEHRHLAEALREAHVLVGAMGPAELRAVIVKPAAAAGLSVERALTSRLVQEVADAPGGLPLLSHVLMETWRRRRGKTLTLAGYEAAGGLADAVAKTAEDVYCQLTEKQAAVARRLLLRLVAPGEDAPDTRRPADRKELTAHGRRESETGQVLESFARARLLTLDGDTVELAHETLLTAWPRLHGWIEQDRERLRAHRRLTEAARAWEELDRDPGALYRGSRLAIAREHLGDERLEDLTAMEHDFLRASTTALAQEQQETARTTRRLRWLRTGLSLVAVLASLTGAIAWQQSRFSDQRLAEATSRRVAAAAEAMRYADPLTAMRLSVAAWRISPTLEAKAALMGSLTQREQDVFTGPRAQAGDMRRLSSDGRTLMAASDGQVLLWNLERRQRTRTIPVGHDTSLYNLSADGRYLLAVAGDTVQWQDTVSGQTTILPLDSSDTYTLFTANDHILKVVGKRSVGLWDLRQQRMVFQRASHNPERAILDASVRFMALCSVSGALEIWDIQASRRVWDLRSDTVSRLVCGRNGIGARQVLLDSRRRMLMVVTGAGLRMWSWDSDKEVPPVADIKSGYVILSRDGQFLVTVDDNTIRVWRTAYPKVPVYRYPLNGRSVMDVQLDPELKVIRYVEEQPASAALVRTIYLGDALAPKWLRAQQHAATPETGLLGGSLTATALGPPGSDRMATGDHYGRVTVWDRALKRRLSIFTATATGIAGSKEPEAVTELTYSPDGQFLAVGGNAGTVRLWDAASNRPLGASFLTAGDSVDSLTFAPDGATLTVDGGYTPPRTYPIAPELVSKTICIRAHGGVPQTDWTSLIPELPYRKTC